MLARTHLAFGFLTGLLAMNIFPTGNIFIFFALILLGSVLPDIDTENSFINNRFPWFLKPISLFTTHRGLFHSLLFALLLPGVIYFLLSKVYGFALFLGYFSHLFIDGFTRQGVNFLHPISKLHLSGFVETGKILEHIILITLVVIILLRLF